MFMKKPRHRIFDYEPRFYNPKKDETEKRKKKLGFRSARQHSSLKRRNNLVWIVLFLLTIVVYLKLNGAL